MKASLEQVGQAATTGNWICALLATISTLAWGRTDEFFDRPQRHSKLARRYRDKATAISNLDTRPTCKTAGSSGSPASGTRNGLKHSASPSVEKAAAPARLQPALPDSVTDSPAVLTYGTHSLPGSNGWSWVLQRPSSPEA